MTAPDHKRIAREAFGHAAQIERRLEQAYPRVWDVLDALRADPPEPWPSWCLLPMGAAQAVAARNPAAMWQPETSIARIAASYAWRYARSVYLVEPSLIDRLLRQVPDALSLEDLTGLPEWCVYIAGDHPEFPGAGLWAHLEYDVNNGRPELRLLLDLGDGLPVPVSVYLDRGSVVEALADWRATALASLGRQGANVRGGVLDSAAARLAEKVDGYLGLLAYLARPEADIVHAERPGARPVRPRRPKRDRDIWLVGYS